MSKREIRTSAELRAAEGDEMALVGYAALFNNESKDLGGFRETIKPGTFTRSLKDKADVKCLFNHAPDNILGRTKSGTLTLAQDDRGLKFYNKLNPESQYHRDIHAAVKRGDIDECSFAFTVPEGGQAWAEGLDGDTNQRIAKRTLTDVDLMDVSCVTYPAYDNTSVGARALFPEGVPVEIRSALDALKVSKRDDDQSLEDQINAVQKALNVKFPSDGADSNCWPGGVYYVIETHDDYAIVCNCKDQTYAKVSYHIGTDGVALIGDDFQPMEKEWVPAEEKSVKRVVEMRGKLDEIAKAHKAAADAKQAEADSHKDKQAGAQAEANTHAANAAASQAEADDLKTAAAAVDKEAKAKRCMDSMGDCDDPDCECQNNFTDPDDLFSEEDDNDLRKLDQNRHEKRASDGKVLTKRVAGKNLTKDKFAFVGDAKDTSTWKLPIHDAAHARNALARFNQTQGIPADKKAGVLRKIKSAAKKFGIEVSEENSIHMAEWLKDVPMDETEIMERRARASMLRS